VNVHPIGHDHAHPSTGHVVEQDGTTVNDHGGSATEPWAWQIDGHHLNLNIFVLGDQVVFTPSFMGSEPCDIEDGPLADVNVFRPEHDAGLAFMRSLTETQLLDAVFSPSIARDALPPELHDPVDGRMQVGALNDNLVLRYDYGTDLLREHHRQYGHSTGTHHARH
jgi:Protein of unknown function (DUF3500)